MLPDTSTAQSMAQESMQMLLLMER